jgi:hypothetical protein
LLTAHRLARKVGLGRRVLTAADDRQDGRRLFGKIYSTSHERADRWYRFGRTILYGQLEDETSIGSVRRLAAYEDYALRLLADHQVRVARTYGRTGTPPLSC